MRTARTGMKWIGMLLAIMLIMIGMAGGAMAQETHEKDGSKIEGIDLFWLTPDSTVDNEGNPVPEAELNDKGSGRHDHLYLATKSDAELSMTYQFEVSFSGQYDYAPGDIQITIPAQVWHNRDYSDEYNGKPGTQRIGSMELSVPAAPSTKADFNWQLINGNYVLTNTKTIGATSKAMFQMSITDIVPHTIVDMMESDFITVQVDVVTNQGNVITRTSDPISAQIDTIAEITGAKKATNNELYEEVPDSIPAGLLANLPEDAKPEDYIYVRWYSYVSHRGNQPFSLDIQDTIGDAYKQIKDANGKVIDREFVTEGILLGFTNYEGIVPVEGTHDLEANVLKNTYHTDTIGSYDHTVYMWSAYKKSDFYVPTAREEQVVYEMHNDIKWILTEYDDIAYYPGYDKPEDEQKVTTAPAQAAVYYMPTRWSKPTGHFEVFKWTETQPNEDWNYGYGLNQLIDEEDVSMNFHLKTVGFGYPWTGSRTNPDDEDYYGHEDEPTADEFGNLGWRQITEDFDTFFDNNSTSLTERDFEITYMRVTVPEKYRYQKAGYPRYGYYDLNGNIVYGQMMANQYGYFYDSTLPTPDLQIEYQLSGGKEWIHAATANWGEDGKGTFRFIDVADGITTDGMKVFFPENTTDVRHIFVSNVYNGKSAEKCDLGAVRWDAYLGIDLKASEENIAIAENWFRLTNTPSTKFRNDVHMFVDGWIKANEDGTPGEGVRLHPNHPNAFFDTSRATIAGASYGVSLSKDVEFDNRSVDNGGDNDVESRRAILHYSAELSEQSNLINRADYDKAVAEGVIPAETKGVWYDLLPVGVTPRMNTIQLRKGDVITSKYSIPDYKGTGRILLVVEADLTPDPVQKYSGNKPVGFVDKPTIEFDAVYTWDAIEDYGVEADNYIAFESKVDNLRYDTLGTIAGQRGNPDDPTAGNNITTPAMPADVAKAMTDLDPNTDESRFVYAKAPVNLELITSALSGIAKVAQNDLVGEWTQGLAEQEQVTVYEGQNYTYRLRVSSSESTTTSDIVIYDTIENYHIPDPEDTEMGDSTKAEDYNDKESKKNWQGDWQDIGQWRGTLESVDLSEFVKDKAAPVLYYSLVPDLTFADSGKGSTQDGRLELFSQGAYDLTDSSIWKKAELTAEGKWTVPADVYGKISAVALDARQGANGEAYVLGEGEAVSGYLHMVAPDDNSDPDVWHAKGAYAHKTDAEGNPIKEVDWEKAMADPANNMYAFNNTRLKCVQTGTTGSGKGESSNIMIRNDYTRVGILPAILKVKKVWQDQNNHDNIRPDEVTVTLLRKTIGVAGDFEPVKDASGMPITVTLSKANNWEDYFYQVDVVDESGNRYLYTFEENDIEGYTLTIKENSNGQYTLTNTHPNEQIELKGEKQWNDNDDTLGLRPESITVKLYRDGEYLKKQTVTPTAEGWIYNFGKLDKYEQGGRPFVYTVEEEYVPKYVASSKSYELLVNDYAPYGDLAVIKTLKDATTRAAENEFTFTIKLLAEAAEGEEAVPLMDDYAYEVFALAADGESWEETGRTGTVTCSSSFTLKGSEKLVIYDLPSESTYEIEEAELAGFRLTGKVNDKGTIRAGQVIEAEFTNTYSASGSIQFNAYKEQKGHTLRKNQHQFQIIDMKENSATYGEVIRTAYSGTPTNSQDAEDGEIAGVITAHAIASFGQLDYTHEDDGETFTYKIVEVNAEKPGYTYADTAYTVTVKVADNGDGTMTVTAYDPNGKDVTQDVTREDGTSMPFKNTYTAEGAVTLKAWKVLEKRELQEGEFTFELYACNVFNGKPGSEPIATAKNDGNGNIVFAGLAEDGSVLIPELVFDQDDVSMHDDEPAKYSFIIKEVYGTDKTVAYTDQVYKYEVTVYDNHDGTLSFVEGTQAGTREWLECEDCLGTGTAYDPFKGQEVTEWPGRGVIWQQDSNTCTLFPENVQTIMYKGSSGTISVRVSASAYCPQCEGSGYIGEVELCSVCDSWGVDENDQNCDACGGYGRKTNEAFDYNVCTLCRGHGFAEDAYVDFVYFDPAGNETSTRYFFTGQTGQQTIMPSERLFAGFMNEAGTQGVALQAVTDYLPYGLAYQNQVYYGQRLNQEYINMMGYDRTVDMAEDLMALQSLFFKRVLTIDNFPAFSTGCLTCGGLGKIEGGFNVDGEASMPVFVNDLHDGNLSVTKQVQGEGSSNPNQEFTFKVRFTGELTETPDYTMTQAPVVDSDDSGETDDDSGETDDDSGDSTTGPKPVDTSKQFHVDDKDLEGTQAYAALDHNTGEMIFFRLDPEAANPTGPWGESIATLPTVNSQSKHSSDNRYRYYYVDENTEATVRPWRNNTIILSISMRDPIKPAYCKNFFYSLSNLVEADLSKLDTNLVTSMNSMFYNCKSLTTLKSSFDTSNVTDMNSMFRNCTSLTTLDLSSFDTSSVTDMQSMFNYCTSLTTLDLSSFGTSNVTSMKSMFYVCESLTTLDLSSFDTSSVTSMAGMFRACTGLTSLDLSSFDTSNVGGMMDMFRSCSGLTSLDLSNFDTSNVVNMQSMFYNCSSLTKLDLSNFDTTKANNLNKADMFASVNKLLTIAIGDNTKLASSSYSSYPRAAAVGSYGGLYSGLWINVDTNEVLDENPLFFAGGHAGTWTWDLCKYKLIYDAGDGAGSMPSEYVLIKTEHSFAPTFYRFGYKLTGMTNGTKTYPVTNGVVTIPASNGYKNGQEITLTAVWKQLDASELTDSNVATFTLKAGQTVTFKNLPASIGYEVWEETPAGWVLVEKTGDSGVIQPLETSKAVFTNEYTPGKAQAALRASKLMDGKPAAKDAFSFKISGPDGYTETVKNVAGGAIQFAPFNYGLNDAGKTYTYTIVEVAGNDSTILYDNAEYTATVQVKDNGEGLLTAIVTYNTADGKAPVFRNTTKPGALSVSKQISGATPLATLQEFTVEVTFTDTSFKPWTGINGKVNVEGGDPIALADGKATFTLIGGDTVTLTDIPAGIRYEVRELKTVMIDDPRGDDYPQIEYTFPGWTMDGSIEEGKIKSTVTDAITFKNSYAAKGHAVPEAIKVLEGRTPKDGEFTFQLLDSAGEVIDETTNVYTKVLMNPDAAEGEALVYENKHLARFDELSFDTEGTYTYTIREMIPEDADRDKTIEYSNEVINVTVVVEDKEGQGRLTSTITYDNNGEANNIITNKVKPGSLRIGKKVVSSNAAHAEKEFTFTLYLTDALGQLLSGEYPMSNGEILTVSNGSGMLKLKGGETVTIDGLPDGASYSVVEAAEGGFTQSSSGSTGKIRANQTAEAAFTNTYHAEGEYAFGGVKTLDGKTLEAGQFLFELYDSEGYVLESVTNDAAGKFAFKKLEFTEADVGEKTYTVCEKNTAEPGVTYDETRYEITLTISDNGAGTLSVEAEGIPTTGLTFLNTYSNETEVTATKQWKDDEEHTDARRDISVSLYKQVGSGEKELVGSKIIPADAEGEALTVKWDGLPVFEVQDGKAVEIEYSVAETMAYGEGEKNPYLTAVMGTAKDGFTIINRYTCATIQIEAVKELEGRELAEGQFEFQLVDYEENVVSTTTNTADGTVLFPVFEYVASDILDVPVAEDGTRTKNINLKIIEVNDNQPGYTYDDWYQNFTITLHLDANGNLTAECNMAPREVIFTNTYEAEGEITFSGKKTLEGRELVEGEFSFALLDKDGNTIETVKNAADGSYAFTKLEYIRNAEKSDLGEHTYTVKEVKGALKGVTYDDAEYTVKVTVTDNGDGTLEVAASDNAKALDFTNTYEAKGETSFSGKKVLEGRELAEGEFSFTLYDSKGNAIETVKNAADGSYAFTKLEYIRNAEKSDLGEHSYTVKEVKGALKGVTYDTTEYTVKVTVTDNGDGTLDVVASENAEALDFTNYYDADGELTLRAAKTVNGAEPREDEVFTFELRDAAGKVLQTAKNAQGKITFEALKYTEADVGKSFLYTVCEKQTEKPGYTTDATVYTVAVWVSDAGDGSLKVTKAISSEGKAVEAMTFENTYEAEGQWKPTAAKTVNGAEPREDQVYEFTLTDKDGNTILAENEKGEITFDTLTYDLADAGKIYTYTVKETTASTDLLAVDESVYTLNVAVTDNKDGTLAVKPVIIKDEKEVEEITFENKLTTLLSISKTVEGIETTETFPMTVKLYNANGTEAEGAYAYTGDKEGKLKSGDAIELGHGQSVTISGLLPGMTYTVTEAAVAAYETTVNGNAGNSIEGTLAEDANEVNFVNKYKTTMFMVKKSWQGGGGGAIELTLYANGEKMEPQPIYSRDENVYVYTDLPMYDAKDQPIVYSAKEKYVDGFLTIYKNVAPYADETKAIYDGGTIINKAIVKADFSVKKVWSGLAEGEEAPAIQLVLYCNGEATEYKTPNPDRNGWYKYYDLPDELDGVKAVYTVKELPVEGYETSYKLANGTSAEYADNGGTITNAKIPQTGDGTPLALWLTLMGASAMMLVLLLKRRKA